LLCAGNFITGTAKQQVERLTVTPKKAMISDVWFTVIDRDTTVCCSYFSQACVISLLMSYG
jgi:hypothetical protein